MSTIGIDGQPHMTSVWALRDGDSLLAWTYRKGQKVRNLERDPRATLMIETGDTYQQVRGASLECDVELIDDLEQKLLIGARISAKFAGVTPGNPSTDSEGVPELIRKQASKRIVLVFTPRRIRTWDHRKLAPPQ